MKRLFLIVLTIFTCLSVFCSCHYQKSREGLDYFYNKRNQGETDSSYNMAQDTLLTVEFLEKYPYADGNYYYAYEETLFSKEVDRAFIWLTYDNEIYSQAKQECLETRDAENADLDGKKAFGFTFNTKYEFGPNETNKFPYYFTAFGYNDKKNTLIFIGFFGGRTSNKEREEVEIAKTDLEGFIKNYFGEWYDWEE